MIRAYTIEEVKILISLNYGLNGEIKELGSYTDKNFLLDTGVKGNGKFIIKISNIRQNHRLILLQNFIFRQLQQHQSNFSCKFPRIIPTLSHQNMITITSEKGTNFIRVFSFIDGQQLHDFQDPPQHLFDQSGELAGQLSLFLNKLKSQKQVVDLAPEKQGENQAYNLLKFNQHYEKFHKYLDANVKLAVNKIKDQFNEVLPILQGLPKQLVHHDICLTNLLVGKNQQNGQLYISGLIDFSETQFTHGIIELVILGARINLYKPKPLRNMLRVIAAFNRVRKLSADEKLILFPMIKTRLAYLCLTSSHLAAGKGNDPYFLKCKNGHISYLLTFANYCSNHEFLALLEEQISKK